MLSLSLLGAPPCLWLLKVHVHSDLRPIRSTLDIRRWVGHVLRMEEHRIPRRLLYGEAAMGTCNKGRPKKRYEDCVKPNLQLCDAKPKDLEDHVICRPHDRDVSAAWTRRQYEFWKGPVDNDRLLPEKNAAVQPFRHPRQTLRLEPLVAQLRPRSSMRCWNDAVFFGFEGPPPPPKQNVWSGVH